MSSEADPSPKLPASAWTPGRWSRAALLLVFVMVPGSINLAIMALLVLLPLGRMRANPGRTFTGHLP